MFLLGNMPCASVLSAMVASRLLHPSFPSAKGVARDVLEVHSTHGLRSLGQQEPNYDSSEALMQCNHNRKNQQLL